MSNKVSITPTVRTIMLEEQDKIYFKSNLNFLKSHGGLRPKCVHTFLGPTHAGKSTMGRTLVLDILINNENCKLHIHLTEETRLQYLTELSRSGVSVDIMNRLTISSEQDGNAIRGINDSWEYFKQSITESEAEIVILDNLTTSEMYADQRPHTQTRFVKRLKEFSQKKNIAMIQLAHTGAEAAISVSRLINENDIRGSKSTVNNTEFLYILQQFETSLQKYSTIRIIKHRGQSPQDKLYLLEYSLTGRFYSSDRVLPFEKLKKIFSSRVKL